LREPYYPSDSPTLQGESFLNGFGIDLAIEATDDKAAGRTGGVIENWCKKCLLMRRQMLQKSGEFFDRSAQFRLNLATLFEFRCIAEFGAQFFDVLFDRHLRLLDVCER
jgi:hypothetical protein